MIRPARPSIGPQARPQADTKADTQAATHTQAHSHTQAVSGDDHPHQRAVRRRAMRDALGSFATGVTIVTARAADGAPVGVTANSFSSVSLEPALVLWSLAKGAMSRTIFETAPAFAINILAADQEDLARRFASQGADKFAGMTIVRGFADVPIIPGVAAAFECRRTAIHDGGDQLIFVGEIMEFAHAGHAPLVFHAGQFKSFPDRS